MFLFAQTLDWSSKDEFSNSSPKHIDPLISYYEQIKRLGLKQLPRQIMRRLLFVCLASDSSLIHPFITQPRWLEDLIKFLVRAAGTRFHCDFQELVSSFYVFFSLSFKRSRSELLLHQLWKVSVTATWRLLLLCWFCRWSSVFRSGVFNGWREAEEPKIFLFVRTTFIRRELIISTWQLWFSSLISWCWISTQWHHEASWTFWPISRQQVRSRDFTETIWIQLEPPGRLQRPTCAEDTESLVWI